MRGCGISIVSLNLPTAVQSPRSKGDGRYDAVADYDIDDYDIPADDDYFGDVSAFVVWVPDCPGFYSYNIISMIFLYVFGPISC